MGKIMRNGISYTGGASNHGGGSTGTSDYLELENKPSINGTELIGNKTADELGLATKTEVEAVAEQIPSVEGLASKEYVDDMPLKTVNGQSLKGCGNIVVEAEVSEAQVTEKVNEVLSEEFPPKMTWVDVTPEVMPYEDYILSKTAKPWENNPTYYKHTKFILPRGGLTIRFSCKGYNASYPAVIYANADGAVLGYYGEDATIRTDEVITLPSDATIVYLNGVSNSIFALDYQTEIPLTDVSANPLLGKKISCIGDSIMYGVGYVGGFIKLIADRNNMTMNNIGVSGATLSNGANTSVHHICAHISDMADDADYYIVEGGFNDYNYNTNGLGELTETMSDEINDRTLIGALESIFRQLLSLYPSKKIGFVITHKALNSAYTTKKYTFNQAHDAIISVCNKYSIPCCDLYNNSRLNTELENMKVYTFNRDGIHPSKVGYSVFYVPQVEAWLKTL